MVGIIAVEGKNCNGTALNVLQRAIFWNEFSRNEAVRGGMAVPSSVVPLGVDLEQFCPGDREQARNFIGLTIVPEGAFVVGNVNRNQNRKRIDLSVMYFAKWIKEYRRTDAFLYLHLIAGSTTTIDVEALASYLGIINRLILVQPQNVFEGAPEKTVINGMRCFDVGLSTSLGEGHGLTAMEMMACGIPFIGGDYSAFGEWAKDAAYLVPCSVEGVMPDVNGMIGGIPDERATIDALEAFYRDPGLRSEHARRGLARVSEPRFRWNNIAARFAEEIERGA